MSLSTMTTKTRFLNSPLISLRCESVNGGSCTRTNIFTCKDCLVDIFVGLADIFIELTGMPIEFADMPAKVI